MLASLLLSLAVIAPAPPPPARLVFIGDSVGVTVDVGADRHDSLPGRPVQAAPTVDDLVAGDTLVIELGSNNLGSPDEWPAIAQLLQEVPEGVHVVWVSPYNGWDPVATADFRDYLALAAPGITVVEWGRVAQPFHTTDGVHLTPVGAWYLSALIAHVLHPVALF